MHEANEELQEKNKALREKQKENQETLEELERRWKVEMTCRRSNQVSKWRRTVMKMTLKMAWMLVQQGWCAVI